MKSGVESSEATVTGAIGSDREHRPTSDGATDTEEVTVGDELNSRIVSTPGNGQLYRARLRFGGRLESDQGNVIPANSTKTHCVAVFERPQQAASAIRELHGAGFDMKRLSVVGRDCDYDERAADPNPSHDDAKYWGKEGTFWGGVFELLFCPASFFIPGSGPVLSAGLIGSALIGMVEAAAAGAVLGPTTNAFVAALGSWGIPKDTVNGYETDLRAKRLLMIASGNTAELVGVHPILAARGASVSVYNG